ncbi:type VI secretion system lipoprotein TssJ [Lysobacter sp. GX 14042]|uniref:type VI secretion system lipoprotein TssJ n=1 Tax=Lysobacter sp. GX 14042 TaxID=2907155 RepID=UPI001F321495|nr:type VI secretion system lipoprotein TssJ [Lysobacter sp. GX 14042]MCE7032264.1 type VI secretion system lipoprotein TssJ [Lysobacter sp. GX 14042]
MEQHTRDGVAPGGRTGVGTMRRGLLLALACAGLCACATGGGGVRQAMDTALQKVGLQDAAPQPRQVQLRLHAGDNLNAGTGPQPLSLVVRVYQLRDRTRFEQAAFEVFVDEQRERDVLGGDVLAVTEFLLAPGQRHEVLEQLPAEGRHLGVVALFRQPAPVRWRLTFDPAAAAPAGITVGLHACAMTTPSAAALQTPLAGEAHSLAGSRCSGNPG